MHKNIILGLIAIVGLSLSYYIGIHCLYILSLKALLEGLVIVDNKITVSDYLLISSSLRMIVSVYIFVFFTNLFASICSSIEKKLNEE
jgi:hypothetical protein